MRRTGHGGGFRTEKAGCTDGHSGRKRRTARASRPYHRTFSSVGAAGPDRPLPGIQATCFRLRKRMNAAPPGSGTSEGPGPIAAVRRGQPDRGHRSTAGANPHISPGEICAASKFLWKRNLARPTGKNGKTKVVVPLSDGVNPGRPDDIRLYRPSGRIFHAMHEISGLRHGKL